MRLEEKYRVILSNTGYFHRGSFVPSRGDCLHTWTSLPLAPSPLPSTLEGVVSGLSTPPSLSIAESLPPLISSIFSSSSSQHRILRTRIHRHKLSRPAETTTQKVCASTSPSPALSPSSSLRFAISSGCCVYPSLGCSSIKLRLFAAVGLPFSRSALVVIHHQADHKLVSFSAPAALLPFTFFNSRHLHHQLAALDQKTSWCCL